MSITASEHCFDFIDAKHDTEASNRYWFDYPEFWFSNQDLCDLSVGLRSVILKSTPVHLYLEHLWVYGNLLLDEEKELIPDSDKNVLTGQTKDDPCILYQSMDFDGDILYPNRILLNYQKHVDEKIDMTGLCNDMNNWYYSKYKNWEHLIERCKVGSCQTVLYDSVQFIYKDNGDFVMSVDDATKHQFSYLKNQKQSWGEENVMIFSDSFHQLLGLDVEKVNLNTLLTEVWIAVSNIIDLREMLDDGTIEKEQFEQSSKTVYGGVQKKLDRYESKYGVIIKGINVFEEDPVSKLYKWNEPYEKDGKKIPGEWVLNDVFDRYTFSSITIKNVWSRKDIRLESSMSEYDLHHYLGYSSYNSNTSTYPQPKIFEIKSRVNKFWINLYDGYTKNPIELPEGISLLMETQLYQSDKPPLNNNF